MLTVTNKSLSDQAFNIVGGATEILVPGETRDLDVADPESPQNVGRLHVGAIDFKEAAPAASEPAPALEDKDAPAAEALQPERRP